MFGGDYMTAFQYVNLGVARREMSTRISMIDFRNAEIGENDEIE